MGKKDNREVKKHSLYKKMVVMALGPVIILGIAITFFCYMRFVTTMYREASGNMKKVAVVVSTLYDREWEGDYSLVPTKGDVYELYKGETSISERFDIIDEMAEKFDCEISVLYMDMRIHTTLRAHAGSGERLVGICTNSQTAAKVLDGEDEFYKDIKIADEAYLVFYTPLKNSDGTVIGMIEIAQKSARMKKDVWKAVWPAFFLSLGGMILAAHVSYKNTEEITDVIKKIEKFLHGVSNGDLQTELDISVLKRKDELGEIGKASTSMQRSIRSFIETDPLTQLGNRRYVSSMLEKVKGRYVENGQKYSIAIGDIDFFKKVNDNYGHNAGDEVLKAVAATLKRMMQGKGFAARWGGEEFIMVFDKLEMADAGMHLEKVLENIREMVVETEGYEIKVTMTFGVVDGSDISSEEMVEAADAKLYYGKQHGRNQVVTIMEEENQT
ncbi:MAG: diguanylate cyclase [Lachnospiraceae bacterium]|nr:diguanylate cyclase [Lachnospiraceae bacterium]